MSPAADDRLSAVLGICQEALAREGGERAAFLDRLVKRCLAKSPDDRPDGAHDVADDLRWLREASDVGAATGGPSARQRHLRALVIACAALLAAAAGASAMWFLRPAAPSRVSRLSIEVRPADDLNSGGIHTRWIPTPGGSRTALTWTPDGRTLLFVGRRRGVQQLYARRLDAAEARSLPGTEGAQVPAVSPDGQWVAFWAGGAIKRAPLTGGPTMDVVSGIVDPPVGLVWDARAGLVFPGDADRIWAVPAEGGKPYAVTKVGEGELAHTLPSLLPGGRVLLYTVRKRGWTWGDEEVVAQPLPAGERKRLLTDAADGRYVPETGHLVFLRRGVLFAVSFDAERLEIRGAPTAVFDGVAQALTGSGTSNLTGAGQFAVASTGTLAWLSGPPAPFEESMLVTVDRRGQIAPLGAPVRNYGLGVRVSPDGRRLAVSIRTLTEVGVWIYDLKRTTLTRLPVEGEVYGHIWSPDGRQLAFSWVKDGRVVVAAVPADGTEPPRVLLPGLFAPSRGAFNPSSWTPDGRTLAAACDGDVHLITIKDGKASVQPLWQTPSRELGPTFSPDDRWLAYASMVHAGREAAEGGWIGRYEVYVEPYPGPGPAVPVSINGGTDPTWHPNGREVFFLNRDATGKRRMMAADFAGGAPPRIGRPRPLFEFDARVLRLVCAPTTCYDVAPDGQRFYAVQNLPLPPTPPVTHVNLIENWFEELKAKVPPR